MAPSCTFKFDLRHRGKLLKKKDWHGPSGRNTYFEVSGASLPPDWAGRWLQYRAVFQSPDGGVWPILDEVSVVMLPSIP